MSLAVKTDPVPLHADEDGVVRISGTRVTLESLVSGFNAGAAPEQLAFDFPTVPLADIYAIVGYYLKHRAEVDTYMSQAAEEARETQLQLESRFDPQGIRERLLARRTRITE